MCDTCGVTEDQYDAARLLAHNSCIRNYYQRQGVDPADYGYPEPTGMAIREANDHIQRYHVAHPGKGLTRDEMVAEIAQRQGVTIEELEARVAQLRR